RERLRRRWTARSRQKRPGRPTTDASIRKLVEEMKAANPLWGAPRIHGELMKLGIDIAERTVSRLLRRRHHPSGQTWRTFLTNHVTALVSMDFFTVPTVTGRVLFVLVLLAHHRRRIVHFAITDHPTAAWTAQQIVEAFPDDTAPRWLGRDRDAIYSDAFRRRVTRRRHGRECLHATLCRTGSETDASAPAWPSRRALVGASESFLELPGSRQSPLLGSFKRTPNQGSFPPPVITRVHRSYEPLRRLPRSASKGAVVRSP